MKRNEGSIPSTAESARLALPPEFQPLHWIHVIYDHSDDTSDLEPDPDSAPTPPPLHRATSMHAAFFAE